MTHSPAPNRSSGKLTINFGIIPIPVAVYSGTEDRAVHRSMRHNGNAVKFVNVDAATGEVISRQETTMVFVMEDGTEVPLSDDEIAKAMGEDNGSCDVIGFYPISELKQYHVADLVQVRPQTLGSGKSVKRPFDRPFAVLMAALATREAFALVRYTLRGKPRLGALTWDGTMRVLYWDDEVRESLPLPKVDLTGAELTMAGQLVDALMGEQAPRIDNTATEKVREYVAAKAKGVVAEQETTEAPVTMDLMEALKASLSKAGAA